MTTAPLLEYDRPRADRDIGLTLAIPCFKNHWHLLPELLDSLQRQTQLPNQTLIMLASHRATEKLTQRAAALYNYSSLGVEVEMRVGYFTAGYQREHMVNMARHDVVSFMDCDDLMHPQRTEIIYKMFDKHRDLNALFHLFRLMKRSSMAQKFDYGEFTEVDVNEKQLELLYPYAAYHYQPQILNFTDRPWNVSDGTTEPNYLAEVGGGGQDGRRWYFPADFALFEENTISPNGHVTVSRSGVFDVPFSHYKTGEDSIYSWRLLRLKKNVTLVNLHLSAYIYWHPE
eukprot:GHVU01102401.1.p1 GENE.GHVU01102401.1~~GHVU01102401.1.p1  ORF type:complete len:306 (-),score=26.24 GHVU01102401.1:924-1781(-)